MANKKDFATSIVQNTPGTSGTTVSVATGEGVRFPAVPFSATVHPLTELPTLDNSERVQVTAKSGDDFTVTRATGDASAKDIQSGWRISNTIFKDDFDEKANASDLTSHTSNTSNPHSVTKAQVGLGNVTNDAQLKMASNLSDLANTTTARTNLGLGSLAIKSSVDVADINATGGTSTSFLRKDGTWQTPTNTTYAEITTAEIDAGTASTLRTITGRRAQYIMDSAVADVKAATDSSTFGISIDEDDMASNSATKLPSQQSVKAYTDSTVAAATVSGKDANGWYYVQYGTRRRYEKIYTSSNVSYATGDRDITLDATAEPSAIIAGTYTYDSEVFVDFDSWEGSSWGGRAIGGKRINGEGSGTLTPTVHTSSSSAGNYTSIKVHVVAWAVVV